MRRKIIRLVPLICILLLTSVAVNIQKGAGQPTPADMYADPSAVVDISLVAGTTFRVDFNISDAHDLHTWQIRLHYNPAVILPNYIWWGDFVNGSARAGPWGVLQEDASVGTYNVTVADATKYGTPEVFGVAVLVQDDYNSEYNFVAYSPDYSTNHVTLVYPLQHTYTVAANAVCYPWPEIARQVRNRPTDGYITMGEATSGPYPGQEGNGWLVSLRFQVQSYGSSKLILNTTESWYMDSNLVKQTVENEHLTLSDGYFSNKYPGDIDGDLDCDYDDFLAFAAAYLKTSDQPGYDIDADFDVDGDVDYDDFLVFAANYLKSFP